MCCYCCRCRCWCRCRCRCWCRCRCRCRGGGRVLLMELPTMNCLAQPSIKLEPSRSSSSTRIYTRYDGSETDFTSSQLIFLHFTSCCSPYPYPRLAHKSPSPPEKPLAPWTSKKQLPSPSDKHSYPPSGPGYFWRQRHVCLPL